MNIIPEIVKEQRIFPSFSAGADWLVPYLKENPSRNVSSPPGDDT